MSRIFATLCVIAFAAGRDYAAVPDANRINDALSRLRRHCQVLHFEPKFEQPYSFYLSGTLRPGSKDPNLPVMLFQFVDEYRDLFALEDPPSELRFPFHGEEGFVRDSVVSPRTVEYRLQQWYCGIPVFGTYVWAVTTRLDAHIGEIRCCIYTDIDIDSEPTLDKQAASNLILPRFFGSDRYCGVSAAHLWIRRIQGKDHLAWRFDLTCGPKVGFHWGEAAWVDAHTGEVLEWKHTWIE